MAPAVRIAQRETTPGQATEAIVKGGRPHQFPLALGPAAPLDQRTAKTRAHLAALAAIEAEKKGDDELATAARRRFVAASRLLVQSAKEAD